jgi:glycosyltransferase involved in cell wall biosynthesis
VVVLSSLFPSRLQPGAGLFIRERMFRLGQRLPLSVIAPCPWFPGQGLIRRWRPGFRPGAPRYEAQSGHDVWYPRFISLPGVLKRLDGWAMALASWPQLRALHRAGRLDVLDTHFGYPDGFAATRLARCLGVPVTITLRGTEVRHSADPVLRPLLGVPPERVRVVGNGVDPQRFRPIDRVEARTALGLPVDAPVLVSVGGLCERKGFHRVIECLPALHAEGIDAHLIVVGGPSPEGDWTERLHDQVHQLSLQGHVHFTGPVPPDDLHRVLSAADVFALATRNEGWANVFLEAMACGLPVVTTDVGGNAEVVCRPELGTVVPFGDAAALTTALQAALHRPWDRAALRAHAEANAWDGRIDVLEAEFRALCRSEPLPARPAGPVVPPQP